MSAAWVSVHDDSRKTQAAFTQQGVHVSQHADAGTARNDRGQLGGQKIRQSLQIDEEESVVSTEHLTKGNPSRCLEKALPVQGSSPAAAAPPLPSASPAPGAQPRPCRWRLWARVLPFPRPTNHLLRRGTGSLPLVSIDPTLSTLMENMVIFRNSVWTLIVQNFFFYSATSVLNSLAPVFLRQSRYRTLPSRSGTSVKATRVLMWTYWDCCFPRITLDRLYNILYNNNCLP